MTNEGDKNGTYEEKKYKWILYFKNFDNILYKTQLYYIFEEITFFFLKVGMGLNAPAFLMPGNIRIHPKLSSC